MAQGIRQQQRSKASDQVPLFLAALVVVGVWQLAPFAWWSWLIGLLAYGIFQAINLAINEKDDND